jgi:hypothetical protein
MHSQGIVEMGNDINHNTGKARQRQDGGKALDGMTEKERAYVTARAAGASKRMAYVAAYDTDENAAPDGQHANAARIERRPHIAAALARAEQALEAGTVWTGAKLRAFVLNGLITEATSCPAPSARVRALELLGKHAGLWAGQDDEPLTGDAAALRQRIERKLRDMLGHDVPLQGTDAKDAVLAPPASTPASAPEGEGNAETPMATPHPPPARA